MDKKNYGFYFSVRYEFKYSTSTRKYGFIEQRQSVTFTLRYEDIFSIDTRIKAIVDTNAD